MIDTIMSGGSLVMLIGIFYRLGNVKADIGTLKNRADRQLKRIRKIEKEA